MNRRSSLAAWIMMPSLLSGCFQSSAKDLDVVLEGPDIPEALPDGQQDGGDPGPEFYDPDPTDAPEMEVSDIIDDPDEEVIPGESWILSLGDEDCVGRAYSLSEVGPGEYVFSGHMNCENSAWIGRFDERGRMIWQKSMEPDGVMNYFMASAVGSDGYLYVAGFLDDGWDEDFWILKLDLDGNGIWQRAAECGDREFATALETCADGGIVVCGSSHLDGSNTWIVKLAPDGSVLWSKFYSYELPWMASSGGWCALEESRDGGIAVARGEYSNRGVPLDLWIMKLSAEGSLHWSRVIEGHWNGFATDLVETETGELIIVGGANFLGPDYDYDLWIVTMSAEGDLIRQDAYGGPLDDRAEAVVRTDDGGLIVGGLTESYGHGGKDMWLMGFSPAGEMLWQKSIGTAGQDIIHSMLVSTTGRLMLAGEGSDGDGTNPHLWLGSIGLDGGFDGDCSLLEETHASARPVEVTVEEPAVSVHDDCTAFYVPAAPAVSLEIVPRFLCPE